MKYEYLVTAYSLTDSLQDQATFLRNYGKEGWELVQILIPSIWSQPRAYWKRPINPPIPSPC